MSRHRAGARHSNQVLVHWTPGRAGRATSHGHTSTGHEKLAVVKVSSTEFDRDKEKWRQKIPEEQRAGEGGWGARVSCRVGLAQGSAAPHPIQPSPRHSPVQRGHLGAGCGSRNPSRQGGVEGSWRRGMAGPAWEGKGSGGPRKLASPR